jgi:hypothetical protein
MDLFGHFFLDGTSRVPFAGACGSVPVLALSLIAWPILLPTIIHSGRVVFGFAWRLVCKSFSLSVIDGLTHGTVI